MKHLSAEMSYGPTGAIAKAVAVVKSGWLKKPNQEKKCF